MNIIIDCNKLAKMCHDHAIDTRNECPLCLIPGFKCPKFTDIEDHCSDVTSNRWYDQINNLISKYIKYTPKFIPGQLVAVRYELDSEYTLKKFVSYKNNRYIASTVDNEYSDSYDECLPAQEVWKDINLGEYYG